ncbi:MAG: hypothetical protein NT169_21370 [Chloroflexi bacterium]|nr:hypothetical protein [Chloroflexota bacterium]
MQRPIQRTLVLGVGPSGRSVVENLHVILEERYPGGVPYVGFLALDLSQDANAPAGGPNVFAPHEHVERLPLAGMVDFVTQTSAVKSMVPAGVAVDYELGPQSKMLNTRLGANLLFQRQATRGIAQSVRLAVEENLLRLFNPPAEWSSRNDFAPGTGTTVAVYVVASAAEAYGGGMLVDLMYLMQSLGHVTDRTWHLETNGVLLLFDAQTDGNAPLSSVGQAHVYATLQEVDRLYAGGPYVNQHLEIQSDAEPFNHSCFLVDLENEVSYSLQTAANSRAMLAEWLHQMIVDPPAAAANPPKVGLTDEGLQAPGVWKYSALGLARQAMHTKAIYDYYTSRLGAALLSPGGLLTDTVDERRITAEVEEFERQPEGQAGEPENNLDAESLLKAHQSLRQCRVSLDELTERRLNSEPPSRARPLNQTERCITDDLEQQTNGLLNYQRAIASRLERDVLPIFRERLTLQTWKIVDERRVGGLASARRFLGRIDERLADQLARVGQRGDSPDREFGRAEAAAQQAAQAAQEALKNRPNARPLLRRIGLLSLLILLVASSYYCFTRSVWDYFTLLMQLAVSGLETLVRFYLIPVWVVLVILVVLLILVRRRQAEAEPDGPPMGLRESLRWLGAAIEVLFWLAVFTASTGGVYWLTRDVVPDPAYNLLVLVGTIGILKIFVWDDLVGLWRSGAPKRGTKEWQGGEPPDYNLPRWYELVVALILLFAVVFVCLWAAASLSTADLAIWHLIAMGFLVAVLLIFWTWYDIGAIRHKAGLWVMARNHLARLAVDRYKTTAVMAFYKEARGIIQSLQAEVDGFQKHLEEVGAELTRQQVGCALAYEDLSVSGFTHPVLRWERVEQIFGQVIRSPLDEVAREVKPGEPPALLKIPSGGYSTAARLSDWCKRDATAICRDLAAHVAQRFAPFWQERSLAQLLVPSGADGQSTQRMLEQELAWIMGRASKPYWRYYGREGTLAIHVGVADLDDVNLRRAIDAYTPRLGAVPDIFPIDSRHVMTCMSFRYNLPLKLIRSVQECQTAYEHCADKATLHGPAYS